MAALTLFLRSAASGVVSSNASVHTLSAAAGSAAVADGTAFAGVVSTNYNVGPGTRTVTTPGGTITGTGMGWIYDTQPLATFAAGTWTVKFLAQRTGGGTYTGNLIGEVYKVTVTTSVVTAVTLIGTADSGAITINGLQSSGTFSGSQITFGANEYLYVQYFYECTGAGAGNFENFVDQTSATAAQIITTTTVSAVGAPILMGGKCL
jgi:hypothetical protein